MKIDTNTYELLCKNKIHPATFHQRIQRGWTFEAATTTPTCKKSTHGRYAIYNQDQWLVALCDSTDDVAKWLTKHLHYTITKNQIVGRFYRNPNRPTFFGKYAVKKEK